MTWQLEAFDSADEFLFSVPIEFSQYETSLFFYKKLNFFCEDFGFYSVEDYVHLVKTVILVLSENEKWTCNNCVMTKLSEDCTSTAFGNITTTYLELTFTDFSLETNTIEKYKDDCLEKL